MLQRLAAAIIALGLVLGPFEGFASTLSEEPRPTIQSRDPRFGIVQSIQAPDHALAAGSAWERIIFPWADMEPRPGAFERGMFGDQAIRDQVARGFTEVGVIIYTPPWAAPDPNRAPRNVVPRNVYREWNDPENYWGRFTWRLASHYAGLVDHWIIWNEPDLYEPSSRWFFDGTFEDYYQLLKVAYQAIKAANPRATVILAGMAYWYDQAWDRPPYLASLLEVAARDPTARRNNWYFDVVAVHTYANPLNSYTQPMLMRRILAARGIDKPIWIPESNVVPADDGKAPVWPGPYQATQDQQASYVIQSLALGIAAGVERQAIYKLLDELPEDGQYFGVVRNDGTVRPAFVAFQVAAKYMNNVRWASYTWDGSEDPTSYDEIDDLIDANRGRHQWPWPGQVQRVVLERGDRRTTVVWNTTPWPVRAELPAAAPSALAVSQYGDYGELVARNGVYTVDLEASTHNADPHDRTLYLVGGRPWILEERVAPLPDTVKTRIEAVWPHNGAPIAEAERVNVTAQLLAEDGESPVPCRWQPRVLLWASQDGGPNQLMGTGRKQMVRRDSLEFPVWLFDNVRVSAAQTGASLTFSVTVDGVNMTPEHWVYGEDTEPVAAPGPPATSCR
jgi:hypothetical protein